MVRLFEVENGQVKVTEHCYTINWLKGIMDKFPELDKHLKIYAYVFYMSYPGEENPYFNVNFDIREDAIKRDIDLDFDTEDDVILKAIEKTTIMYDTLTARSYRAVSTMLDNIDTYIETAKVTAGRDGNLMALIKVAEKFEDIRRSHKALAQDLAAEQHTRVWGNHELAYDQDQSQKKL